MTNNYNVFIENKKILRIEIEKGEISKIINNLEAGFGYTDLTGNYISGVQLNDLSSKHIIDKIFYDEIKKNINKQLTYKNNFKYINNKIKLLLEIFNLYCIFKKFKVNSHLCFEEHNQDIFIINENEIKTDSRRRYNLAVSFNILGTSYKCEYNDRFGEGTLLEKRNITKINAFFSHCREAFLNKLKSKTISGGIYPVVLGNGSGGIIFHEAVGHLYEFNDFEYYKENIGKKVCDGEINIIDNGRIRNGFGSSHIDDEGTKTRINYIIKNGVVSNFLINKADSIRYKLNPTGNGRRESYKYCSCARMTNTYLDRGKILVIELIKNVTEGIYVPRLSSGTVNEKDKIYSFNVEEAYMIRNGKIIFPLRDIIISGKIEELLANIKLIGDDLDFQMGGCYGESGIVPISVGCPTVLINNLCINSN